MEEATESAIKLPTLTFESSDDILKSILSVTSAANARVKSA
jgi:hypothetical protein